MTDETLPPQANVVGIRAAQITMGRGLVDVTQIDHEGRSGILFRPRDQHIPVGDGGEMQAGEYWPVEGDVVIWIESEGGAQVIQTYLTPFLATSPQPISGGVENFDRTKAEQAFTDYFVRNYPGPDTIIFDPKWHAPKLFAAAVAAIRAEAAAGSDDA